MRQLATAGSILLACLLGFAPSAHARNRYTAAQATPSAGALDAVETGLDAAIGAPSIAPTRRDRHRSTAQAHAPMAQLVLAAALRHGVPSTLAFGVASVESGFNPHAHSRSGAVGLMQILPATARGLGCSGSLSNPAVNADCGVRYLAAILGDHGGDMRVAAAMSGT